MIQTTFNQGYLQGQSHRYTSLEGIAEDEYDAIILVSSWDMRSIEITKCQNLRSKYGILVVFSTKDEIGLRDNHDAILSDSIQKKCSRSILIQGHSTDLDNVWQKMRVSLSEVRKESGRTLRILIDLCACPRYYALALLAFCFKYDIAHYVSIFYAEANYPEQSDAITSHDIFTAGGWTAVNIPGLEGIWEPERKLYYLVSVGFEGSKTLRLISRQEPDRVSVLFPKPGVREDYPERTLMHNKQLIDLFQIPDEQIVCAHAGDAIAAWKALKAHELERPTEENVNYVCCGSKPHSIAFGLRAMLLSYPAVLYIVPDRHKVASIEASGTYWRYDIQDLTSLEFYQASDAGTFNECLSIKTPQFDQ